MEMLASVAGVVWGPQTRAVNFLAMPICGQAKNPQNYSPAHARQASESSARRMVCGLEMKGEERRERGKKTSQT